MKKNNFYQLIIISAIFLPLFFTSCKKQLPKVRFYNATNANFFWKYGGCKYGKAEFIGKLNSISTTDYKEVEPDDYFVEFQNSLGQWIPITVAKVGPVKNKSSYSIWITVNPNLKTYANGDVMETGNDNVQFYFEIKED